MVGLFLQGKVFSFWGFAPDPWPWALSLHFSGYGLQTPNITPNTLYLDPYPPKLMVSGMDKALASCYWLRRNLQHRDITRESR